MWRKALSVATVVQLLGVAVAPARAGSGPEAEAAVGVASGDGGGVRIDIPVGARVRLKLGGMHVDGLVSASDDAGLTIVQPNGVSYRAAREALDGLEVARPRPRLKGAVRGALLGAAIGGGIAAASLAGQKENPDGTCTDSFGTPEICTTGSQVAEMASMSAFLGFTIGLLFPGPLGARAAVDGVRVGVGPAPGGGVAARASVRF
jgi:hypothetical protein